MSPTSGYDVRAALLPRRGQPVEDQLETELELVAEAMRRLEAGDVRGKVAISAA